MKHTSLPTPGTLAMGGQLRIQAANLISRVQIAARGNKTKAAKDLQNFFTACAAQLNTMVDSTAPTVVSRVRTSATVVTLTFSEVLAAGPKYTPAASAFTVGGGGVVTGVSVSGSVVLLSGTGFATGASVAYAVPANNKLHDIQGNAVAAFSGTLA